MTVDLMLAGATAVVSVLFAGFAGQQWLARRRPYQAVWSLALFVFAMATAARVAGVAFGWDEWSFKLWYGAGAYGAAALLGMGTAYLLLPRGLSHVLLTLLLAALATAVVALVRAPVDLGLSVQGTEVSGAGLPAALRAASAPFNLFGTVFFIGGAVWSGARFLGWWPRPPYGVPPSPYQYFPLGIVGFLAWCGRSAMLLLAGGRSYRAGTRAGRNRAVANCLIAAGGLIFAASGSLSKYFGVASVLYVAEFAGTLVLFAGFLVSSRPVGADRPVFDAATGAPGGRTV